MRLKSRLAQEIADRCAEELISTLGEASLTKMPYDALSSEMSELVGDIEDKIDKIIVSKVEERGGKITTLEDLWEDQ